MGEFLHSSVAALCFVFHTVFVQVVVRMPEHDQRAVCSLEEHIFFVESYYSTQKNLKEVLRLYGEQFNVPWHKWPSKSVIIT